MSRKKVLQDVTKSLKSDAQFVKCDIRAIAQSSVVERARLVPFFQSKVRINWAVEGNTRSTIRQFARPRLPLFTIKLCQNRRRRLLQPLLLRSEVLGENPAGGISFRRKLLDPFEHYVRVAEIAEAAKELLSGSAHLFPGRIRIEDSDAVRHGTAAPKRSAQIVDRVSGHFRICLIALLQDLLHPVAEPRALFRDRRCRHNPKLINSYRILSVENAHRTRELASKERDQNSRYPTAVRRSPPSVPLAGRYPSIPRNASQAAAVNAGSELTNSLIICHAAMLRAPSGAGPMASETEHCGQKHMRWAADFCRGRTPTVWAKT